MQKYFWRAGISQLSEASISLALSAAATVFGAESHCCCCFFLLLSSNGERPYERCDIAPPPPPGISSEWSHHRILLELHYTSP